MRIASMLPLGLLSAALAAPANAGVTAAGLGPVAGQAIIPVAGSCPPGSQWVPPGYARKGKWKGGYCSTWIPYRGYSDGYGQSSSSPTEGIPRSWQPSASSHPPSEYGY
jgi:hypothetical protein